jgi:hypothetical protein
MTWLFVCCTCNRAFDTDDLSYVGDYDICNRCADNLLISGHIVKNNIEYVRNIKGYDIIKPFFVTHSVIKKLCF